MLFALRVYPQQTTKKKLKFTYLYLQSEKKRMGLSVEDLVTLLMLIAVQKREAAREEIAKMMSTISKANLNS